MRDHPAVMLLVIEMRASAGCESKHTVDYDTGVILSEPLLSGTGGEQGSERFLKRWGIKVYYYLVASLWPSLTVRIFVSLFPAELPDKWAWLWDFGDDEDEAGCGATETHRTNAERRWRGRYQVVAQQESVRHQLAVFNWICLRL